ncbi:ATP-dependent zinc protease family protein [Pseudomonas viridiflava]|uniref:ATP-dependent zinc protease family protein n=1 Tax=Pseudomonas viridiflava TaxID=33069 RepID=UPI001C31CF03|nr:ATP-dependent zinc protease [Pseudomonas viridiflava]QXG42453.1 ATP-dependent zinc protease [Pseudomonas viridiflava]
MKYKIFTTLCFVALLPNVCISAEKKMYGAHENVRLPEIGVEVPAKLDTGAKTASLSARDIKYFKRNGKRWVSFSLAIEGNNHRVIEKPLAGIDHILRRAADRAPNDKEMYTVRPVILLSVCIGKTSRTIEVNLTDRSAFTYPFLFGATALKEFGGTVDPSLEYTAGNPECISVAQARKQTPSP